MIALTDRVVLEAWAGSRAQPANERADALLACALVACGSAVSGGNDPANWSLARRHATLAQLRASRWGNRLDAVATCPACGCDLSAELDLALLPQPIEPTDAEPRFRLPTRADVRSAAHAADPRTALVEGCLIDFAGPLEAPVVDAVAAAMEAADPVGALELALTCPECEQAWEEPLDLDDFLAVEAEHDARSIAAEVHELAVAYGWSETEILALPTARRRLYLELVAG